MAGRGVDAVLNGHNARSVEDVRSEFGETVSHQGVPRDELIDAIMGYGEWKAASASRAVPQEEFMQAMLWVGEMALASKRK